MHGWAKCMKPEVCFVVGLVSFSGTAGVGKKRQGHEGQVFCYFQPPLPKDLSLCLPFYYNLYSFLIYSMCFI